MAAPRAGGFRLSLASAKSKPGLKASLEKSAKRPRLALGDEAPDDDNKQQEISGWDAAGGGAVELNGKKEEDKGPRVIPVLPNRNWREDARRRQNAQGGAPPGQGQGQNSEAGDKTEGVEQPKIQYGLTVYNKEEQAVGEPEPMGSSEHVNEQSDGLTEEQRLEKNALDALVNGKATDYTVIPVQSEEEAFQNDMLEAPDAPTLEAYEATPIEGFGAALLRGMGWKDGDDLGKEKKPVAKPKEIKRRSALLGIGAKEEAALGVELGEWGGGKGKGRKKTAMSYNPVALKNKVTGEIITEEELKERLERQKILDEEKPAAKGSKYDDDDEEDERRRRKRREQKERRRRDENYDSERRSDKNRRKEYDKYPERKPLRIEDNKRSQDRDDRYYDGDRRRDQKRSDRDRRDRSRTPDRQHRKSRHRSRSPESDERRDKRRERDRRGRDESTVRDSDQRKKRGREYDYEDERDERKRRYNEKDDGYSRK